MSYAVFLLAFVTVQRLGELVVARRNTRRLLARGAREVAGEHYPLIVALHAAWLIGLWALGYDEPVNAVWLGAYTLLQVLRGWTLSGLGERWTTRILVVPGETLVRKGPYRFIRHPNYAVVVGEIAVLPLALGMEVYALAFSALNAAVLFVRIRAENRALAETSGQGRG